MRFRAPRCMNAKNAMEPYDEGLALVSQLIQNLKDGKYAN